MKPSKVFVRSLEIRDKLKQLHDSKENPIDTALLPVLPYRISSDISLIILGQDPTVKNPTSRDKIEYTLNLDKNGSLKSYVIRICQGLGIAFVNIYATNIFKYFYSDPPAGTPDILYAHLEINLALVKEEIAAYPKAKIITLGEPVLHLLAGKDSLVRDYWGYNNRTGQSNDQFKCCLAQDNRIGRDFYPFPHQPSIAKRFYMEIFPKYIKFMKSS
ncbi:MAG: hypothetical protein PHD61_08035 [Bacteroidales bacterium]|nr:hypothetical protein [Lentimicrobiaceae bacterium]MDD5695240.1 hypothetical protein [Bacteroidales bacterium]